MACIFFFHTRKQNYLAGGSEGASCHGHRLQRDDTQVPDADQLHRLPPGKDGQHVCELHLEHRAQRSFTPGHPTLPVAPQTHSLPAPHTPPLV